MRLAFWKKKTIIDRLNKHMELMTDREKIEHLKAIIPQVCPGISVHRNRPKGNKKKRGNHAVTPSTALCDAIKS